MSELEPRIRAVVTAKIQYHESKTDHDFVLLSDLVGELIDDVEAGDVGIDGDAAGLPDLVNELMSLFVTALAMMAEQRDVAPSHLWTLIAQSEAADDDK